MAVSSAALPIPRRDSPGVKVTATNEATGVGRDADDQRNGDYVFPEMQVGIYTLTFDTEWI